ncbi:MAG: ABC transporter substrate-binding protein [Candidatus Limnocylindrales bacterium]|jgi:peptide/nickel transport system substrate-binding protein
MRTRLIGLLGVAALVAGACGQSTATASGSALEPIVSAATPGPTPIPAALALTDTSYTAVQAGTTGGKVVIAEWQFPDAVNPYFAGTATDVEVAGSMFDGLVKVTPDLRYVPDLALTVPTLDNGGVVINGGGMDVTWKLRLGMQWSDGQPINCDDIKATWQWITSKDNTGLPAGATAGWQDVTGVDGGSETTCVMHFDKLYEGYLTLVSSLLPAHYITTVPIKDAKSKLYPMSNLASGVYSGPYIPSSLQGRTQMTLKPNPNWQTIGGHAPWLSAVTWKYYADAGSMINGFSKGDYDVGQDLSNADIPALSGVTVDAQVIHDSRTYELLAFNNASFKAKFDTDATNIIQAIKLATDRGAIAQGPLLGNVTVSNNFVSPLSWYYKAVSTSTAADPTTASVLLANAGWTKGADGYLTKGGKTLELSYCTTTRQYRLDTLKLMAAQLKQIGIKVDVNAKSDSDVFGPWTAKNAGTLCNLSHGNYDVAEFSYVSPLDPLLGYKAYYSSQIPDTAPNDGQNVTRIGLPGLDSAYDAIATTVDFNKVRDSMFAIQDIYGSDRNTYELPLYFRKDVWLANPKIHNFTGNPMPSGAEWNIADWWVG